MRIEKEKKIIQSYLKSSIVLLNVDYDSAKFEQHFCANVNLHLPLSIIQVTGKNLKKNVIVILLLKVKQMMEITP